MAKPIYEHRFIIYARPFHVWMNGIAVFLTVIAVLVAFFIYPDRIKDLTDLVGAITVALTGSNIVSGLYIWKRSEDKKITTDGPSD